MLTPVEIGGVGGGNLAAALMVAHLKLLIARLRQERFGASSERSRKLLDQTELQLEELEAAASEDEAAAPAPASGERSRRRPVRGPLPAHRPRERVVLPSPAACPCCGARLSKLGEDIVDTYDDIVAHCCDGRNKLIDQPWHIISIGMRDWAHRS